MSLGKKSPFSPQAKRVFKGVIFDVWQWKQKMFDGSMETFERIKRPDTVQVIAVVKDKILLEKQKQPAKKGTFLSLPGGRCDKKENPLKAAQREMLEETGYASKDWTLWKKFQLTSTIGWTFFVFIARGCVYKQAPRLDAGEKITTTLIDFEKFLALSDNPSFHGKELAGFLMQARFNPRLKKKLAQSLFHTK